MKQVFPKEIIDNTVEVHLFRHKIKSQVIYTVILLSVILAFALLPFIRIDIYTSSAGIIKPEKERIKIVSIYAGKVIKNNLKENQQVKRNDTLLIIDNSIIAEKIKLLQKKIEENQNYIWDLDLLINSNEPIDTFYSPKYQKDYLQFQQKIRDLNTKLKKVSRDFYRQRKLYRKRVIAKVKYLESKYSLDLIKNEKDFSIKQQKNKWQNELSQYEIRLDELKNELEQSLQENDKYFITAPVNGSIQNLMGINEGSIINVGNPICEISPDADLLAECYVSPADIGLLKKSNPVKFQIDAYDYNQWGMATGEISDISKDVSMINNNALYKVRCKINERSLFLKNGAEGQLKKGMTLRARFLVANRSLFDLLYDKVDDWFNPSKNQ